MRNFDTTIVRGEAGRLFVSIKFLFLGDGLGANSGLVWIGGASVELIRAVKVATSNHRGSPSFFGIFPAVAPPSFSQDAIASRSARFWCDRALGCAFNEIVPALMWRMIITSSW
jgi:hypothetical protein